MSKVFKVLSLSFLLCLSLVIAPFHISADETVNTAPFVGFNVHILDIDAEYKQIDRGKIFVPSHSAYITGQLNCSSWRVTSSNTTPCDIYEFEDQSNSYVNGTRIGFGGFTIDNTTNDEFVGTVYKRIYEVEFVLDGSYVGYVTFFDNGISYTDYVNGTSFNHTFWSDSAQSFDITISDYSLSRNNLGAWNFPIESFPIISSAMQNLNITSFFKSYDYYLPFFSVKNGDEMFRTYSIMDRSYYMIFMINRNIYNINQIKNYWTFNNCDVTEYYQLNRMIIDNQYMYILKLKVVPLSEGQMYITSKSSAEFKYCPIYWGRTDQKYISTDFALQFGLTNDYLDATVYGTDSSNQSSSNLDDKTSDLNTSSNQLVTQEDTFNNDMNSALQNIDTNFNVGSNFGSKFIASADWVKTQYDRLTGNTPFGSVISFSLLIGLALLLVGKVFK